MFKHVTISIGFDEPQSYDELVKLIEAIKASAQQDQTNLSYFTIDELTPEHSNAHKA